MVALSNVNGEIVERYSYDVFGEATIRDALHEIRDTSAFANPYMFTGRRYDDETGLYYYRARYYNPEIGRFLQTDPIGYDDGLNMYSYVGNNPINWIDPLGLKGDPLNANNALLEYAKTVGELASDNAVGTFNPGVTPTSGVGFLGKSWRVIKVFVAGVATIIHGFTGDPAEQAARNADAESIGYIARPLEYKQAPSLPIPAPVKHLAPSFNTDDFMGLGDLGFLIEKQLLDSILRSMKYSENDLMDDATEQHEINISNL